MDFHLFFAKGASLDEAERESREVLEKCKRVLTKDDKVTLGAMNGLAGILMERGKPSDAEAIYREILQIQVSTDGTESESARTSRNNLGLALRHKASSTKQSRCIATP
jgi:hypothetical protein